MVIGLWSWTVICRTDRSRSAFVCQVAGGLRRGASPARALALLRRAGRLDGLSHASIDVQHDERFAGQSTYTLGKLWRLASENVIAYSDKPLRLSIRFGFIISVLAFAYGSYISV
jgi:hypothetical protein